MGFKVDFGGDKKEFPTLAAGTYTANLSHWKAGVNKKSGKEWVSPVFTGVVDGVDLNGEDYPEKAKVFSSGDPDHNMKFYFVAMFALKNFASDLGVDLEGIESSMENEDFNDVKDFLEALDDAFSGDYTIEVENSEYNGKDYANVVAVS